MLNTMFNWMLDLTQGMGYFGVGILMTIESSFIPLPSEIVIPPAAYLASQGKMNLLLIIIFGVLGSILGAVINYLISMSLGRFLVYKIAGHKLARFVFVTPEKIERAEKYFLTNANSATFFGRLIPVVRQFISIPAGFSRMHFGNFILYTALGSTIWVSILAGLGYFLGANQELLRKYYKEISVALFVFGIIWIIWKFWPKKK